MLLLSGAPVSRKHREQAARVVVEPCPYVEAMAAIVARHRRRGRIIPPQVRACLRATLDGVPVGYAVIGEPSSRHLNPQGEVRRVVSWAWGAASALYRAAEAAGACLTYTDPDEPGHSLRAAGWFIDRVGKTGPYWSSRPGREPGAGRGLRVRWRPPSWHK